MRGKAVLMLAIFATLSLLPVPSAHAWRGGFGGFRAGGFGAGGGFGGFSSFHAGGFGDGFGSVCHGGASHWGPVTGFTHVSGTAGAGPFGYGAHGEVTHVGPDGVQHYGGSTAGGWGGQQYSSWHGYDDGAWSGGYHTSAYYHPYNYGSVQYYGGALGGAAVYHGPAGGTAAVYHGPYSCGAVVQLPAGYTAAAWHGTTYYHYGYSFYHPVWVGGSVTYVSVAPPIGFFFAALPPTATTTVINNTTYYIADGVYYQPGTQNGQTGYVVAAAPGVVASAPPAAPPTPVPGPDPLALFKAMSDYLGHEKNLAVEISESFDEVAVAGQKVQINNRRTVHMARPDKLKADITGNGVDRSTVYDGETFTLIDRIRQLYASIPMHGSLDTVLGELAQKYGMAQPFDDLLYTDLYARLSHKIKSGQYLGEEKVDGKKCDVVALSQPGVNWQLWIEKGHKPVPRKIVITYPDVPSRPQYTLQVTQWDTPIEMRGSELRAQIPDNAMSASLATITGQVGAP